MAETKVTDVEAARAALKMATHAASLESKVPRTKAQKIRELRQEIALFRSEGKSWQEVAQVLAGSLHVSAATIRQVLGAKKPGAKPSKPPPTMKARTPAQPAAAIGKRRTQDSKPASDGPKRPFGGHELSSGDQKWLRGRLYSPAQRAASSGVCRPLGISLARVFGEAHVAEPWGRGDERAS